MITSVKLNDLELCTGEDGFAVGRQTLVALKSGPEREPVANTRPGTFPEIVRSQIQPKPIQLVIYPIALTTEARRTAYAALVAAAGSGYPTVPLSYEEDSTTFTWQVHCSGPVTDEWYHEITIATIAFNPEPVES